MKSREDILQQLEEQDFMPEDVEALFPGCLAAMGRLNERTGACDPEELFAGWIASVEDGRLHVAAEWPHYLRTEQTSFVFDGSEFV